MHRFRRTDSPAKRYAPRRSTRPRRVASLLVALVLVIIASPRQAVATESSPVRVSARCQPAPAPGRVLCEIEVEVVSAERLDWADAQVVAVPAHVTPLRGRVGPRDAASKTATRLRLPMAFVATENGEGQVSWRVRAVSCRGATCAPTVHQISASLRVGVFTTSIPPRSP